MATECWPVAPSLSLFVFNVISLRTFIVLFAVASDFTDKKSKPVVDIFTLLPLASMAIFLPASKEITFLVLPDGAVGVILDTDDVVFVPVVVVVLIPNVHSSDFFATSVIVAVSLDTSLFSPST